MITKEATSGSDNNVSRIQRNRGRPQNGGFIRKLPHHLVASFRATLEEAGTADVVLHVIDASHAEWEEQVEAVNGVLHDLELDEMQVIHVFNKLAEVEKLA